VLTIYVATTPFLAEGSVDYDSNDGDDFILATHHVSIYVSPAPLGTVDSNILPTLNRGVLDEKGMFFITVLYDTESDAPRPSVQVTCGFVGDKATGDLH
jgi:hypothetical protein